MTPAGWFWAKTTSDGRPGLTVSEHMVNVGMVASFLAATTPGLLERFQLSPGTIGGLAALHDLGKISPGFQRKCKEWLTLMGLDRLDANAAWASTTEPDHGKVTQAAVQTLLEDAGAEKGTAACIAALLGAHHGQVKAPPDSRPYRPQGISEAQSGVAWASERATVARDIMETFHLDTASLSLGRTDPALWWLAGLVSVADWIGSDETHFPAQGGLEEEARRVRASRAVRGLALECPRPIPGLGFGELFGFPPGSRPNDLQVQAREQIQGPGVYLIEAPMGIGKTEAALLVAYELLQKGLCRGVFFALPTQATSNRIHLRLEAFIRRITPDANPTRLIHAHSWLERDQPEIAPAATAMGRNDDARVGSDWFASAKRALLAPFGVGTVDQALLAVLAAKHFFVRRFALAGKVVILDEIHSYDLYTGTLIDRLVECLKDLGCTVIILSATLTGERRNQLLPGLPPIDVDPAAVPYPLVSALPEGGEPRMATCSAPPSRHVQLEFRDLEQCLAASLEEARHGQVVLWICDTVRTAQEHYRRILERAGGDFLVGLLHSRFPFWRRSDLEASWMERLGKEGKGRCGCILVSTQIVEQSVDLDADLMVTELAPTDMLLQRLGRLWRHDRPGRTGAPRLLVVKETIGLEQLRELEPRQIVAALGAKAYVYAPYVLLRTLTVWQSWRCLLLPDQIRALLEATYGDGGADAPPGWQSLAEPEAWSRLFDERYAKGLGQRFLAQRNANLWQVALDDQEGVQTRLNELPTVQLVLCQGLDGQAATFLDGTTIRLAAGNFDLTTAKAIHRNVVQLPRHHFQSVTPCPAFAGCLFGEQAIGLVMGDAIKVEGLKPSISLRWSMAEGVVIEKHP